MATLSQFFTMVAPLAPGAPEPAIENAVRLAAAEFCAKSLALQRWLPSVVTVVNQPDYTLTQAGEEITSLLSAWLDAKPLEVIAPAALDGQKAPDPQTPTEIQLLAPMIVRLTPTPSEAGLPLIVRAAMTVASTATQIDDGLFQRHGPAIADGAVAWLLGNPSASYFNQSKADRARAFFNDSIAREKVGAVFGHARSSPRPRVNWC